MERDIDYEGDLIANTVESIEPIFLEQVNSNMYQFYCCEQIIMTISYDKHNTTKTDKDLQNNVEYCEDFSLQIYKYLYKSM